MTVVSEKPAPAEPDAEDDPSAEAPSPRSRRRPELPSFLRGATWRFWAFTPALLVLVLMVPVLAWKGFSILRNEDTGTVISQVDDPDAPGFEALVTPTPTALLVDTNAEGGLTGVTLITTPTTAGGGNIVFFPVGTLLEVPLRTPPEASLVDIFAEGGMSALEQRVETLIGAGITQVIRVPPVQWTRLVQPVAPLTVDNPVAVEATGNDGQPLAFPEGEIQLAAEQVGPYLQARAEGEADTVRLERHQAFWTAWLEALDNAGRDAVPGEGNTGVGGFVRGLLGGGRNLMTLPATPVPVPGLPIIDSDIFRPNVLEIVALVPDLIPFPVGVGRLRTRVVMGVDGQTDALPAAARSLVQAGAEISVIANADPFGQEQTEVVFFDPDDRERAQRLLDALGVGELVQDRALSDTVDVVVVLGQDYIDSVSGASTETTVPAGAGDIPLNSETGGGIPGSGVTPGPPGGVPAG